MQFLTFPSTKPPPYGTRKGKLRSHRNCFYGKRRSQWPCIAQPGHVWEQAIKKGHADTNGRRQRVLHSQRQQRAPLPATHCHSHTVEVNELTLSLVALGGQEVFKAFDLVLQLWVQIELRWKLGEPIPGGQNKGTKRGGERRWKLGQEGRHNNVTVANAV